MSEKEYVRILKPTAVCIEEYPECWPKEMWKAAGAIYGVYLYDDAVETHACSVTASFELHPIGTHVANRDCPEQVRDEIDQLFWSAEEPVSYVDVSSVNGQQPLLQNTWGYTQEQWDDLKGDTDEEKYRSAWEEVVEEYQGNWPDFNVPDPRCGERVGELDDGEDPNESEAASIYNRLREHEAGEHTTKWEGCPDCEGWGLKARRMIGEDV